MLLQLLLTAASALFVTRFVQEEIYQAAIAAVEPHKAKVKVMRMFTNEAALQVAIESLDYV